MKVPADAWPRQPRTYLTTSATPQSREQGARGSRDVEMRDETKEGRTGKKEERRKKKEVITHLSLTAPINFNSNPAQHDMTHLSTMT